MEGHDPQHDEALLHKLQRHVQTTLDGSAGSWRRNTQAQALWTLATCIAIGLSQGQTLQDVMEPLLAGFAYCRPAGLLSQVMDTLGLGVPSPGRGDVLPLPDRNPLILLVLRCCKSRVLCLSIGVFTCHLSVRFSPMTLYLRPPRGWKYFATTHLALLFACRLFAQRSIFHHSR